jgi:2-dehydro-3-deoxyphosphooctonate aldolase (KDO 8-P synthase)
MLTFEALQNKFFVMAGPNVIETEEHTIFMAKALKQVFARYDVTFIFKVSFDKANRTSLGSYRGVEFSEGCRILKRIKDEVGVPIVTDVHEPWQAAEIGGIVDVIQVPAFLCRQTDLLEAVARTGCIIQVKKGQFCSAATMHKSKEKLIAFGNPNVILCERGNTFGYQDLIVDSRNLVWLRSDKNLVSMDITHCLQSPSQTMVDGTVVAGGHRDLIPQMGKLARAFDVNGIFLEVHDRPDESLCDAPTQWYLDRLEELLDYLDLDLVEEEKKLKILCCIPARFHSSRLPGKPLLLINKKTVIQLTYEQALKTSADHVVVLTDSPIIKDEVESFGGNCTLITEKCLNGTDRILKYLDRIDHTAYDVVVNLQGDEPFVDPKNVDAAIQNYLDKKPSCSTMCFRTLEEADIVSKSRGKAVVNDAGDIVYCSRNVIPSGKHCDILPGHAYNIHVGVFVFDKQYLLKHYGLGDTPLQLAEDIEWLKILETGFRINTIFVDHAERGIDTKEDYQYLKSKYTKL